MWTHMSKDTQKTRVLVGNLKLPKTQEMPEQFERVLLTMVQKPDGCVWGMVSVYENQVAK